VKGKNMRKNDEMTIEVRRNGHPLLVVPKSLIPEGSTFRECYETDTEIIVIGWPEDDDENHDCDQLGCSTLSHVLYRFKK
jgi:hypothetical protein